MISVSQIPVLKCPRLVIGNTRMDSRWQSCICTKCVIAENYNFFFFRTSNSPNVPRPPHSQGFAFPLRHITLARTPPD